ncbi:MAG: hypothetical protein P1V97_18675 [Planctomycetota bacterium]|nr:hypothetical protein [Planctomycetota bacterium]
MIEKPNTIRVRTSKARDARCPACLDSIAPSEATLLCPDGHAAIHEVCRQLLSICPSIGCYEELSDSSAQRSGIGRAITITEKDLFRPKSRNRNFDYLCIQTSRDQITSWNRWTFAICAVFGSLTFLSAFFVIALFPALIAINQLRVNERRRLRELIRDFGGARALQQYEGGMARAQRRGREMRRQSGMSRR